MQLELITVTTGDGIELDGALYRPEGGITARPVLLVHGLTWNFYRGPVRWLAPALTAAGHPCLSLNMRDHDLAEPKDFALSHHDLRAGIDHLIGRFSATPALLAHGYACNKAVCYAAQSDDRRVDRYML